MTTTPGHNSIFVITVKHGYKNQKYLQRLFYTSNTHLFFTYICIPSRDLYTLIWYGYRYSIIWIECIWSSFIWMMLYTNIIFVYTPALTLRQSRVLVGSRILAKFQKWQKFYQKMRESGILTPRMPQWTFDNRDKHVGSIADILITIYIHMYVFFLFYVKEPCFVLFYNVPR
jgi:hypothetical protein